MRTSSFSFALSLLACTVATVSMFGCSKVSTSDLPSTGQQPSLAVNHLVSLKLGEQPGAFPVIDVTGPAAGDSLCYRCKYGSRPTVVIFARELTPSVASLVEQFDQKVSENQDKKLSAFMVALTEDNEKVIPELQDIHSTHHLRHTPLTVFNDPRGPAGYSLSPVASVQVMMWDREGIKVNEAIDGDLSSERIAELVSQTKSILQ